MDEKELRQQILKQLVDTNDATFIALGNYLEEDSDFMDIEFAALDTTGEVKTPEGNYPVKVVQKPFFDPKKKIASKS